jgi:uncharacterized protein
MRATSIILGSLVALGLLSYGAVRVYTDRVTEFAVAPLVIETERGPVQFTVEMAITKEQWERGLMFRKSIAPDAGMLFDLGDEKRVSLWMKNTLVPLDMIFIRANSTIVQIAANAKPLSTDLIASSKPVRAVLEIAGGRAAELGIKPGDHAVHAIFGNAPR